jgi:hypothetical protein
MMPENAEKNSWTYQTENGAIKDGDKSTQREAA